MIRLACNACKSEMLRDNLIGLIPGPGGVTVAPDGRHIQVCGVCHHEHEAGTWIGYYSQGTRQERPQ
jgi:RNA polymerase subunit RPABC4/transcription elongation factor Spt4